MFSIWHVSKQPPKNYFIIQLFCLKLVGVSLHGNTSKLYKIYTVLCIILLAMSSTLMDILEMFRNLKNLHILALLIIYGLTHAIGTYKQL